MKRFSKQQIELASAFVNGPTGAGANLVAAADNVTEEKYSDALKSGI